MLSFEIILDRDASKFIKKQDTKTKERLRKGIAGLAKYPFKGDVKKLAKEKELYRLRVGSFRIIFTIDLETDQIIVEAIGNRGEIYKNIP